MLDLIKFPPEKPSHIQWQPAPMPKADKVPDNSCVLVWISEEETNRFIDILTVHSMSLKQSPSIWRTGDAYPLENLLFGRYVRYWAWINKGTTSS